MARLSVVKFGGSSLANGERIKNACDITLSDPARRIAVFSAPGKISKSDPNPKVTELLIDDKTNGQSIWERHERGQDVKPKVDELTARFARIEEELGIRNHERISGTIPGLVERRIEEGARNGRDDAVGAIGEKITGELVVKYFNSKGINARFIDPQQIIPIRRTKVGRAYVDPIDQPAIGREIMADIENCIGILPGFYGYEHGNTYNTTKFNRGGSDVTAAVAAASIRSVAGGMDIVHENFSDVDGICVTAPDKDIIANPKKIGYMSHLELAELTLGGSFGVFMDAAVAPLARARIPIHIRNTFKPDQQGTYVVPKVEIDQNMPVRGIAYRGDYAIFNVLDYTMGDEIGVLSRIMGIFADRGISIEHVPTSHIGASVIVSSRQLYEKAGHKAREEIESMLSSVAKPDEVKIVENVGLVSVVGEAMEHVPGVGQRIFGAVSKAGINVASALFNGINFTMGVQNGSAKKAVRAIYEEFFGAPGQ